MKKMSRTIGLCLLSVGFGVLIAIFLPDSFLICIEACLIIVAGALIVCS